MYQYTAGSRNGVVGTANLQNGPKVSCQVTTQKPISVSHFEQKHNSYQNPPDCASTVIYLQVEIEVPQMCKFIMHTRGCTLSEVSVMEPEGQPVYKPVPDSDAFRASMEKSVLNVVHVMMKLVFKAPDCFSFEDILLYFRVTCSLSQPELQLSCTLITNAKSIDKVNQDLCFLFLIMYLY